MCYLLADLKNYVLTSRAIDRSPITSLAYKFVLSWALYYIEFLFVSF